METHPTQKDSKLQGIHEHHPSNSKHVKYSVQLKERIESNIKQSSQAYRTNNQTKTHVGQDQKGFSRL